MNEENFIKEYRKIYNDENGRIALIKAPGRVNIIGEHIDYMGYGVLPIAIANNIQVLIGLRTDNRLVIGNVDKTYEPYDCAINDIKIDNSTVKWYKYYLCGVKGALEMLGKDSCAAASVLVQGTIPPNAGLSSSSALVCAAFMSMLWACDPKYATLTDKQKVEIADACAKCERYIGTAGGGMDQAVSILAKEGQAQKIDFNPLRVSPVNIPILGKASFVIMHSLSEMNKAASAEFNIRVTQSKIAIKLAAGELGFDWRSIENAQNLQNTLATNERYASLFEKLSEAEKIDKTGEIVVKILEDTIKSDDLMQSISLLAPKKNEIDKLLERAPVTKELPATDLIKRVKHIYPESARVLHFIEICKTCADIDKLGQLMNDSHMSCSTLYQCSNEALDLLCAAALKSGAVGSRLTGAGWGGCAVALVEDSKLASFLKSIKSTFYDCISDEKFKKCVFVTTPKSGASINVL